MPIRIPSVALCAAAVLSSCSRTTTSPADAGLGTRLRVWTADSAAVLATEQVSPLWSATQMVVNDSLSWRATWQAIYANRIPMPSVPSVDFTSHSILVYGLGTLYASLRFDSVTYHELGNAAYLTDTRPGSNCIVPGIVLAPVIAVRAPEPLAIRKWYLRDIIQQCS
jgi:hypothetical protein